MPKLYLQFKLLLGSQDPNGVGSDPGVLFHRWLPDGMSDALTLKLNKEKYGDITTNLWFERRGYVKDRYIEYDHVRKEVAPVIMEKQGLLVAGPLYGLLTFHEIDSKYIETLCSDNSDLHLENYQRLGKLIGKLIFQTVSGFIHIIRTKYGQYWVHELREWDSQIESLTNYCKCMNLKWKIDEREDWRDFHPDPPETPSHTIDFFVNLNTKYEDYISREDWQNIQTLLCEPHREATSEKLFIRARENSAGGDLKWALIDAVSAMELCLDEFIRIKKSGSNKLKMGNLFNLDLPTKTTMIAAFAQDLSPGTIEEILKGIEIRNELVHEGKEPPDSTDKSLIAILEFVGSFLPLPCDRFPSPRPGNMLY